MRKTIDYSAASTSQLEEWSKHSRGPEDAQKIREELRSRGGGRKDTGTMSLFTENPQRVTTEEPF